MAMKIYKIINLFRKTVLDASVGYKGRPQLWNDLKDSHSYAPNANNQKWLILDNDDDTVQITNIHFNKCLDTDGKKLFLSKKGDELKKSQKWMLMKSGGHWKIMNYEFLKVVEAIVNAPKAVQLWADLGNSKQYVVDASNQKWILEEMD